MNQNRAQVWLTHAETFRRERGSPELSNAHFKGGHDGEQVIDYAEPLAQATLALSHLSEGIAGKQMERSIAAMIALDIAQKELKAWMRLAGYLEGHPDE